MLNWKQILALADAELNPPTAKETLIDAILSLKKDDIDRKGFKKLFLLCQDLLGFQGNQISYFLEKLQSEQTLTEEPQKGNNEALFQERENYIQKLESDLSNLRSKNKELNEELGNHQKRFNEMRNTGEDSPDALSEIERQEELLNKINVKNKHIKRLLRDINAMEEKSLQQVRTIQGMDQQLRELCDTNTTLHEELNHTKCVIDEQLLKIEEITHKMQDNSMQVRAMEEGKLEREREIEAFGRELETRAVAWRNVLTEKDVQIEELQRKYEAALERCPSYDIDEERREIQRLSLVIKSREDEIEELQLKIQEMVTADELYRNMLQKPESSSEEKSLAAVSKHDDCCKEIETQLQRANGRCEELEETVKKLEDENISKTKQTMEAIKAMQTIETGEPGLAKSMKRNLDLQHRIDSRDKQIRALVMELNEMNEISQENIVLRKRLGLPDDEFISTRKYAAQQKRSQKLNERLTLKLRASEEIRLQLQLDKNSLKRKIERLRNSDDVHEGNEAEKDSDSEITSTSKDEPSTDNKECLECTENLKTVEDLKKKLLDWEGQYSIVVDENENLRTGMHEILEKLQDYSASSDHITIDSTTLERLLYALDARSISGWYHPAMRMQNELIAVKERELALKERVNLNEKIITAMGQNKQMMDNNVADKIKDTKSESTEDDDAVVVIEEQKLDDVENGATIQLNSSEDEVKVAGQDEADATPEDIENERLSEMELAEMKVFKEMYEEMKSNQLDRLTEDEKATEIINLSDKCHQLGLKIVQFEKRSQYLAADYECISKELIDAVNNSSGIILNLKNQLAEKQKAIELLEANEKLQLKESTFEENFDLKSICIRMHLGRLTSEYLQNIEIKDFSNLSDNNKVAVIEDNSPIQIVTQHDYNQLKDNEKSLQQKVLQLEADLRQLNAILKNTKEQLTKQQQMDSHRSDEQIALRHMVADLQSQSTDKYLIGKLDKELQNAAKREELLKISNEELQENITELTQNVTDLKVKMEDVIKEKDNEYQQTIVKMRYLKKTLVMLQQDYCKFTPLCAVIQFMEDYKQVLTDKRTQADNHQLFLEKSFKEFLDMSVEQDKDSDDRVNAIKSKSRCLFLEQQLKDSTEKLDTIKTELDYLKLKEFEVSQHWNTIEMLFGEKPDIKDELIKIDAAVQAVVDITNESTQFEDSIYPLESTTTEKSETINPVPPQTVQSVEKEIDNSHFDMASFKFLESQLKQSMILASTRSTLLLETENRLAESQTRVKILERNLEEREKQLKELKSNAAETNDSSDVLAVTIASLQSLLSEKDTTIARFQDLVKNERDERAKLNDDYQNEVKMLRSNLQGMELQIKIKLNEIETLKARLKQCDESNLVQLSARPMASTTTFGGGGSVAGGSGVAGVVSEDGRAPSDEAEFSDKYIEDMFLKERGDTFDFDDGDIETTRSGVKLKTAEDEIIKLQMQLREAANGERMLEKQLLEKDHEVEALSKRLSESLLELKDITASISHHREIEQMRQMLEEKDKHIQDLSDTLNHFHDDQQKFIIDTSLDSAEQVSQLNANLHRCEATNRVLNTQIEALKRQIVNLTQREKQARELTKTLKNQLIKRPVIAVKPERLPSGREDLLTKRIHQLESELFETRDELKRQIEFAESRKARNASDLGLWQKQKHFQQLADKYKAKLNETQADLEKAQQHFATAKSQIGRLEREKHLLEGRLRAPTRYCTSPTCPHNNGGSPDSYVSISERDTTSPPPHPPQPASVSGSGVALNKRFDANENMQAVIDALKSRVEQQQRKIVAMELDGKGGNAITNEVEKLHEKISSLEAQNIRLDSKNFQLQIDNDMMRQADDKDRMSSQIKYLEDYVMALKSELSDAVAHKAPAKSSSRSVGGSGNSGCNSTSRVTTGNGNYCSNTQLEQTILALKRIVERLRVENKHLKDSKEATTSTSARYAGGGSSGGGVSRDVHEKLRNELESLQKLYSETLDRISSLQIELQLKCSTCGKCQQKKSTIENESTKHLMDEMQGITEKLAQKTQLLEKAKILLSRAAAKEKQLKEQIVFWKRRCSELQNVPVIEEASE